MRRTAMAGRSGRRIRARPDAARARGCAGRRPESRPHPAADDQFLCARRSAGREHAGGRSVHRPEGGSPPGRPRKRSEKVDESVDEVSARSLGRWRECLDAHGPLLDRRLDVHAVARGRRQDPSLSGGSPVRTPRLAAHGAAAPTMPGRLSARPSPPPPAAPSRASPPAVRDATRRRARRHSPPAAPPPGARRRTAAAPPR